MKKNKSKIKDREMVVTLKWTADEIARLYSGQTVHKKVAGEPWDLCLALRFSLD